MPVASTCSPPSSPLCPSVATRAEATKIQGVLQPAPCHQHCHWTTHHPAAPTPGHNRPQICLPLYACHWQQCWLDPTGLCSHPGKARREARAGQGRTFTGQQQDQTPLPFLTNKDHLTAQSNHRLHQHWSQLPIMGTTWHLQEKSQSKGLKFTFQESSSGPGSPPGSCRDPQDPALLRTISKQSHHPQYCSGKSFDNTQVSHTCRALTASKTQAVLYSHELG